MPPTFESAEELFAHHLYELDRGESSNLESLLAEHTELANEVRDLDARWREVERVLGDLGGGTFILTVRGLGSRARAIFAGEPDAADLQREAAWTQLLNRLDRHAAREFPLEERGELGRGGMGRVLEAYDPDLRRTLAMKVALDPRGSDGGSDSGGLARFVEEAQLTAQLDHPGIVPIYSLSRTPEGDVFYTMRRIRGRDLSLIFSEARDEHDGWNVARALEVLLRVCETVAYAHSRGVVHRDLKPANVMVGEFGEVTVVDWGLARVIDDSDLSREAPVSDRRDAEPDPTNTLAAGTPAYMPPEQLSGRLSDLDARSDVYALGAMLYELLSDRLPYQERFAEGVDPLQLHDRPPTPLHQLAPDVPEELIAIQERAMAIDRDARYSDMEALAADLRAHLEGRVVTAHRTGPWVEFMKWVARNRAVAGLALVVLGVSLAGLAAVGIVQGQGKRAVVEQRDQVLLQGSEPRIDALRRRIADTWPATPENLPRIALWLRDEAELAAQAQRLEELAAENRRSRGKVDRSLARVALAGIGELAQARTSIEHRRGEAAQLGQLTIEGPEAARAWTAAIADIAESELYGFELRPQLGLLPLDRDPAGIWSFWAVGSGTRPERSTRTGRWAVEPPTGIVFVLVPGGPARLGSLTPTALQHLREPYYTVAGVNNTADEQPLVDGFLEPYFLSAHEITQAQYERVMGTNPSTNRLGPTHPVEYVRRPDASEYARRMGLSLPTELQWEHARGTDQQLDFDIPLDYDAEAQDYHYGPLADRANFADRSHLEAFGEFGNTHTDSIEDGFAMHAPVGSFLPNPWGLHDMAGNVWEWCADDYAARREHLRPGDGLVIDSRTTRFGGVLRGGSWAGDAWDARRPNRLEYAVQSSDHDIGFRVARSLSP